MSRSAIRSAILFLQGLVALVAAGGAGLGTVVYLDGRGRPEGFAELAGFLGAVFAAWCVLLLVGAVATILRLRRERPGGGALAVINGVLGLVPVILLGASAATPVLLAALPFGVLMVLGVVETAARED